RDRAGAFSKRDVLCVVRRQQEWATALFRFGKYRKPGFCEWHSQCGDRCSEADAVGGCEYQLHAQHRILALPRSGIDITETLFPRVTHADLLYMEQVHGYWQRLL